MVNRNAWKAFALTGLGVRVPLPPPRKAKATRQAGIKILTGVLPSPGSRIS
jgi:hypothetical protein